MLPFFVAVRRMGGVAFKPQTQVVEETKTSLNHMPIPKGSWKEAHDKNVAKWNMYMAASAVFLAVTLVAVSLHIYIYNMC